MRRIAYILSAYTDAPHLARLVAALDDGGADFYIHVDRKVDSRPFHRLLDGKATFVPSHWISWGGWQQVEYQKELLAAVLHSGRDYMRVVCLSGQDYPLWSNMRIRRYFDEHPDAEFIMGLNLTRCTDRAQRSKICCYHFFRDLPWRNLWWKNNGRQADVYFGSDYWAVTLPCARYIYEGLCSKRQLVRYFHTSFVPSELCIQTLVFNSPFARHALLYEGDYPGLSGLTPLHYIEYGHAIKTLTLEDLPALHRSDKMFCRKVVSGVSDRLADQIDQDRQTSKLQ